MNLLMTLFLLIALPISAKNNIKMNSQKGWELYYLESNNSSDAKKFALLEGTNSLKKIEEIATNKIELKDLEVVLSKLDQKQFVSLSNRFVALENTLPQKYKNIIQEHCNKHKLHCFLGE